MIPDDVSFDISDYETQGIIRAGWGCALCVSLAVREADTEKAESGFSERAGYLQNGEQDEKNVVWEAVLPNKTTINPHHYDKGIAFFQIPFEITGTMIVKAYVGTVIVAELEVNVVGTDKYGKSISGWTYSFQDKYFIRNGKVSRGWFLNSDNWYYANQDGVIQTGWNYVSYMDKYDWYFFDSDGRMNRGWKKIGNTWYYFHKDGSMASNEWINGYWLSGNGAWKYQPKGRWRKNSKGWWFEDERGWYPKGEKVKINCVTYTFDEKGYLVE